MAQRGLHGVPDEPGQGDLHAREGCPGFGGLDAARFRRDGSAAIVELDVRGGFGNGFHDPKSILGMPDLHAYMQRLDFHGFSSLARSRRRVTQRA